jgi:hypothetical protein
VRAAVAGRSVGEGATHQQSTESFASVQDLSLRFSKAESGRSAQRASALFIVLSAMVRLEIVGALDGRKGEQLSRAGQSAKAVLTNNAQSRARPYRTSLSGSARRKSAGARNAESPSLTGSLQSRGRWLSAVRQGRESERLSRAGPSAKAALTGSPQSRARLYRASLSGLPGRRVAARATRKGPN